MDIRFQKAIKEHQAEFGLDLTDRYIEKLDFYYEGVKRNNGLLHLVGNADPKEFAIRHVLESLFALQFLPENAFFADLGSGAGLPGIPCLIAREDLRGVLIESKEKKSEFLTKALGLLNLSKRADVFPNQFDETEDPGVSHIMCRAIDGFAKKLPRILKWSNSADLILFAGGNIREVLVKKKIAFETKLIPQSDRRFIFYVSRIATEAGIENDKIQAEIQKNDVPEEIVEIENLDTGPFPGIN